jgi:hypothetical protein
MAIAANVKLASHSTIVKSASRSSGEGAQQGP